MAREQGTFSQSANYELQKEGTIDARQFVDVFEDLLNFTASNYIAEGFPVTVRQDSTYEGNTYKKGWYQFLGGALNDKANWEFMGGGGDFDPNDYDLADFPNESSDPYAKKSEIPQPFDPTYLENEIQSLEENKVDKEPGKGLSDENFSLEEKEKLANIEEGAQVNVIPDWAADTSNPRRIDNKPTKTSDFINDGATGVSPFAEVKDLPDEFDPTYLENEIADLSQNKQDNLGFIPEDSENKAEALTDPNNTTYPTTKAVADAIYLTDIILSGNAVLNVNWDGSDVITAGYSLTVNPNTQDYEDSFEVYLYNNSATDSAIVLTAKTGVTYTVIDNDVSSATVYLQAYGTAVIKRIGNTQNYIVRGYII